MGGPHGQKSVWATAHTVPALMWTTALPSKQEKYLITHLHAWSIAMEHAKNYEIRCKII